MNAALINSIGQMIPNGNRLELPKDLHFNNYAQVKKCLIDAGGIYKKCGFEFPEAANDVQQRLVGGEAINEKKAFQFFPTPEPLARKLVAMSGLEPGMVWLEPSAGQGAISNIMSEISKSGQVVELMEQNVKALIRQGYSPINGDFLTLKPRAEFDVIVANPPFTKNQDIDHIRHMYEFLKPGGRLVSVASVSWTFGSQKKQVSFREWLDELGANIEEVPEGAFSQSGTQVRTAIVSITK